MGVRLLRDEMRDYAYGVDIVSCQRRKLVPDISLFQ